MQFSRFLSKAAGRLTWVMTIAFAMLLSGMTLVTVNGLWQNERLLDMLDEVIDQRSENVQLTTDLLEAAYNRHQSLVNQLLTDDPFERDALRMQFDTWGNRVGAVRSQLRERLEDPLSQAYLEEQDALIPEIVTLQQRIVRLAGDGQVDEAMALLGAQLFDRDRAFDQIIEQLRTHERQKMEAAMQQARTVGREARSFMMQAGVIGLLFAVGLMWLTLRSLASLQRAVRQQGEQLEAVNHRLNFDASHDPLTGLSNRRAFYARLEDLMASPSANQPDEKWLVVYVDLNDFKPVNDRLGHAAGDQLLAILGRRLAEFAIDRDALAARLGGDEFVLLHPAGHPDALQLPETLRSLLSEEVSLDVGVSVSLSPSIGIACWPEDAQDPDALLQVADQRMYADKATGRQRRSGG
ncbi:MAG: diguanylate cyclase domain-containing protein [Halothiobacillaceae bacterium]